MKKTLLLLLILSKFLYSSLYSTGNPIIGSIQNGESIEMIIRQIRNVPELVNEQDELGLTALHLATQREFLAPIIPTLLGHGADPDKFSPGEGTPLHIAARKNNTDALMFLIDAVKQINPPISYSSITPLHEAAIYNSIEVYALLVMYGARTDLKTKAGHTAIQLAKKRDPDFQDRVNLFLMGATI